MEGNAHQASRKNGDQTLAELCWRKEKVRKESCLAKWRQNEGVRAGKEFWAPFGLALGLME